MVKLTRNVNLATLVLLTLFILFISVLCAIIIIRALFAILLHFARKKYQKLRQLGNKKSRSDDPQEPSALPKEDEELIKTKNEKVELIPSREQQKLKAELNEVKIVDIVQPVGFWTSMILGRKLTYLVSSAQLMNKNRKKGFWVSMIEAQERAAGRERGRGRW